MKKPEQKRGPFRERSLVQSKGEKKGRGYKGFLWERTMVEAREKLQITQKETRRENMLSAPGETK